MWIEKYHRMIIAIDGGAASGKSTTARLAAKRLGYRYLDTGALYRAITWAVLKSGVSLDRPDLIVGVARETNLEITHTNDTMHISVDGLDVTDEIRSTEISRHVATVSEIPQVRNILLPDQRAAASDVSIVVEGRDIGSVIFPNADVKFYFTASLEERASRRFAELQSLGVESTKEKVLKSLKERDEIDTERSASPLRKPVGALEINTSDLTIEEQVERVVARVHRAEQAVATVVDDEAVSA